VRTGLVLAAVAAAALSTHLLEAPLRTLPRLVSRTTLSLGMGAVLVGLVTAVAVASPKLASDSAGTVLNADGERVTLTTSLADPLAGFNRGPNAPACSLGYPLSVPDACDFADVASDKRAILLGDSHAGAIFYGLRPAAESAGWRLTWWSKNACNIADVTVFDEARNAKFTACDRFKKKIYARTIAAKPDLVILNSAVNLGKRVYDPSTGKLLDKDASYDVIVQGWRSTIKRFTDAGIRVVVIHDWPRSTINPIDCLAKKRDARRCSFPLPDKPNPEVVAVKGMKDVTLVEVSKEFCTSTTCTPVMGNLLVYRDTSHFTRAYAEHLAPLLQREVFDSK
jgi:hypothetical protein